MTSNLDNQEKASGSDSETEVIEINQDDEAAGSYNPNKKEFFGKQRDNRIAT